MGALQPKLHDDQQAQTVTGLVGPACVSSPSILQVQLALKQARQSHFVKLWGFLVSGMKGTRETQAYLEPPKLFSFD